MLMWSHKDTQSDTKKEIKRTLPPLWLKTKELLALKIYKIKNENSYTIRIIPLDIFEQIYYNYS